MSRLLEIMATWIEPSNGIRAAILHENAPGDAMDSKEEIEVSFACLNCVCVNFILLLLAWGLVHCYWHGPVMFGRGS